jgi:hypothetical protein
MLCIASTWFCLVEGCQHVFFILLLLYKGVSLQFGVVEKLARLLLAGVLSCNYLQMTLLAKYVCEHPGMPLNGA